MKNKKKYEFDNAGKFSHMDGKRHRHIDRFFYTNTSISFFILKLKREFVFLKEESCYLTSFGIIKEN